MPSFEDMVDQNITGSEFHFSSVNIDKLDELKYTVANISADVSGSMWGEEAKVDEALQRIIKTCQNAATADNILLRLIAFNNSVQEIFGFKPIHTITPADVAVPSPGGGTALNDAVFSSVGAVEDECVQLFDQSCDTNGIEVIITDGYENSSKSSNKKVRNRIKSMKKNEAMESNISILVAMGCDTSTDKAYFTKLCTDLGIDHFLPFPDMTEATFGKLVQLISQSISSQSKALGNGGPSQIINPLTGAVSQPVTGGASVSLSI